MRCRCELEYEYFSTITRTTFISSYTHTPPECHIMTLSVCICRGRYQLVCTHVQFKLGPRRYKNLTLTKIGT